MSKRLAVVAVVLGLCLVVSVASAEQITPLTIVNYSAQGQFLYGTHPEATIDGDTGSVWYSEDCGVGRQYIVFDLGAEYVLDNISMWFYCSNGPGYATVTVGDTVALDGNSLPRVKDASGSVSDVAFSGVSWNENNFAFVNDVVPAGVRYVDVWASGPDGYTGGIYEIKLYGTLAPSGDPIPEPATLLLVGTGALGVFGYARRRMMK